MDNYWQTSHQDNIPLPVHASCRRTMQTSQALRGNVVLQYLSYLECMTGTQYGAPRWVSSWFTTSRNKSVVSCKVSLSSYNTGSKSSWACLFAEIHARMCSFFKPNIGQFTPKIVYFHYLKKCFLAQSFLNTFYLILKTEALMHMASQGRMNTQDELLLVLFNILSPEVALSSRSWYISRTQ